MCDAILFIFLGSESTGYGTLWKDERGHAAMRRTPMGETNGREHFENPLHGLPIRWKM